MRESFFIVPGRMGLAIFLLLCLGFPIQAEDVQRPRKKPQISPAVSEVPRKQHVKKRRRVSPATFYEARGPYPMTWPQEAIDLERANCRNILQPLNVTYEFAEPIGGPDHCGSPAPVEVSVLAGVKIHPPATLNCQFAARIHKWVRDRLQPAAKKHLGSRITTMTNVSSYTCRKRRGSGSKRMSEHAYANALDISVFAIKKGGKVSVEEEWGSDFFDRRNAQFLKSAHAGGCKTFSTFLGPDYNAAHANHFHMDFGRDGRGGICR